MTSSHAQALAHKLTGPQAKALLSCVKQDPEARVCSLTGRSFPVDCDGRSRGVLVELDLLGWAAGWDDMNTVLPLGREVADCLSKDQT